MREETILPHLAMAVEERAICRVTATNDLTSPGDDLGSLDDGTNRKAHRRLSAARRGNPRVP